MPFQIIQHQIGLLKEEIPLKPFRRGGDFRVCLAYPNSYQAGMSNLGFQTIFSIFSSMAGVFCDRAFMPKPSILKLFSKGKRTLMGWQSEKPLQEFDLVAFSVSFETDYLNICRMLELSGIPLLSRERDESHPLIMAGGAAVTVNPEAIADFIDLFVTGEGEPVAEDIISLIRKNTGNRKALLQEASHMPGVYVPSAYRIEYNDRGLIDNVKSLTKAPFPIKKPAPHQADSYGRSCIITPNTEFSDTYLLEVARGCPYSCRFCCVSLHNKPFRPADIDSLKACINQGLEKSEKIGLLGAAVGSHPHFNEILDYIIEKKGQVSFASLRADLLSEEVLLKLHRLGQHLLTLAPETGSQRLREVINKSITGESLLNTVKTAVRCGFREFRLYFMLGIPGEEDEDVNEAVGLIKETADIAGSAGGRILISVNQFIPKPHTPLERFPLAGESVIARRLKILQEPFYHSGAVKFKIEGVSSTILQTYLSRANRTFSGSIPGFCRQSEARTAAVIRKSCNVNKMIECLLFKPIDNKDILPWSIWE